MTSKYATVKLSNIPLYLDIELMLPLTIADTKKGVDDNFLEPFRFQPWNICGEVKKQDKKKGGDSLRATISGAM